MKTAFSVVPDTNIVVASEKSVSGSSPNKEFFARWKNAEFEILCSDDTLLEYINKLKEKRIPEAIIKMLIRAMLELGRHVEIEYYHLRRYPSDSDDIAFLLCAVNGDATHIVTYDPHLKELNSFFSFKICETLEFLFELREELQSRT